MNHATAPAAPAPSPVDRFLHRAAARAPHRGGYLGVVGLLDGHPPGITEIENLVADTVTRVPALAFRVGADSRRVWEPADGLDPARHPHELRIGPGPDVLRRIADRLVGEPFPPDAASWGVWLVTGWAADQYALAVRGHHALLDAQGGLAAVAALMLPGLRPPLTVPARAEPPLRPVAAVAWAVRGLRATVRPTARWTPARTGRAATRTLHTAFVDTARLTALAATAGGTVNQVYLAATAGALRAWTPGDWAGRRARRPLHAFVPVETRPPGHELVSLGNHLAALRVPLPCAEPDARRRLESLIRTADAARARGPVQRAALRT
ncbi:WS/DGAT/MGAT family O-acyltransferase, partial [Streptomyces specialis]|uniref:hypothetical protein n=1 Tax=Streptomyces specialis TaxID=498367 RepID=UPI00073FA34C